MGWMDGTTVRNVHSVRNSTAEGGDATGPDRLLRTLRTLRTAARRV
jgi:hypothetical protein